MRKITGKVATFIFAAALATFAASCTNSPLAPADDGEPEGELCYSVNGHIVCVGDH